MFVDNFAHATGTGKAMGGIGNAVDPNASIEEWRSAAGWDWTIDGSPAFYRAGNQALVDADSKILYRSDNPETVIGRVGAGFEVVQPSDILNLMDQLRQETGVQIDSLGTIKNGKKFWGLASTDDSVNIGGESIHNKILGATANNGSMGSRFGGVGIRPVCANTLAIALGTSGLLSITHRSKVNWEKVRRWILDETEQFYQFGDIMQELYKIPVDAEQSASFVKAVVAPDWNPQKEEKAPRQVKGLVETLNNGVGQKEAGKTAFGLLNAVTRFVDHDKQARSDENRADAAMFGQGNVMKNQAFDILLKDCVNKWGYGSQLAPVLAKTKYEKLLTA